MEVPETARVAELITQAYVHNTRGYCRSVLAAIEHVVSGAPIHAFFPPA
jgi:hypothetical protein